MPAQSQFVTLQDGAGTKAVIAPELGGWLLRFMRDLPQRGWVDALYFAQEVVDRYPNQMYAGNPVLFPQVSFTHTGDRENQYDWQGKSYTLPQHGFARRSSWKVSSVTATSVSMELTDSAETQKAYPFSFRAGLTYSLESGRLIQRQTVQNTGKDPMPFSIGIHPYFPVPMAGGNARNDCYVEMPASRVITPGEKWQSWSAQPKPAHRIPVSEDASGTLFFTDLAEPRVSLVDPNARLRIALDMTEAPRHRYLAVWSKSTSEPYYCLEPWTALPNSLSRKESEVILLQSGEMFSGALGFSIEPM